MSHLDGNTARRGPHLRAAHLGATDAEGRITLNHHVIADADVVAGVRDRRRKHRAVRDERLDFDGFRRYVALDPAARAGGGQREHAVLLGERRQLLPVGVIGTQLRIPPLRRQVVEQFVARAFAELVVSNGADSVVFALAFRIPVQPSSSAARFAMRIRRRRVVLDRWYSTVYRLPARRVRRCRGSRVRGRVRRPADSRYVRDMREDAADELDFVAFQSPVTTES